MLNLQTHSAMRRHRFPFVKQIGNGLCKLDRSEVVRTRRMKNPKELAKIYKNHRDNQVERILAAAEASFIRDGIDNVSMSVIADEAQISRKTIYEYFADKHEIAWALFERLIEQWSRVGAELPPGTGYRQLEWLLAWATHQLETDRARQRILVEFNILYAREMSVERMQRITNRPGSKGVEWVAQMIRNGIVDGSIRADVDPELTAAALLNMMSGMNAHFALLGDHLAQEYARPMLEMHREIQQIFLRGLQAVPTKPQRRQTKAKRPSR